MNKLVKIFLVSTVLFALSTGISRAQEADSSASLKSEAYVDSDYRVLKLRSYLSEHNSPLELYASDFVRYADLYGLDYRLVPAIAGVESTFGKRIPAESYNAYGWANGDYKFDSWEDSIEIVSMTLKTKYIDKGAPTINKIARRYAPPSATWAGKVKYFVAKIDSLPVSFDI